jgi:galactokinase
MLKDNIQTTQQANAIRKKFADLYHSEPILVRSPGRINLIVNTPDYNEGFVMPAAIDREIIFAIGFQQNLTVHFMP